MAVTTVTLAYTGAAQDFTVPDGVYLLTIEGSGAGFNAYGCRAKADVPVQPGDVVHCYVGGQDGWNGGGAGGAGATVNVTIMAGGRVGCGATDVRIGGTALTDRVLVASGSSGPGGYNSGIGGSGSYGSGVDGVGLSGGAQDGTQASGGTGGSADGSFGAGGTGVNTSTADVSHPAGGGGGAGWYGGAGGSYGSAGGAGSSHIATTVPRGAVRNSVITTGVGGSTADGWLKITYQVNQAPNAPVVTAPSSFVASGTLPASWVFSDPDPSDIQTAADVQTKVNGAADWTVLSSAVDDDTPGYSFPADTFSVGDQVEIQVQTYDRAGSASGWSASVFATAVAALTVAPTITSPDADSVLSSSPASVSWTVPDGYAQEAYQTRRTSSDGATVFYTGSVIPSTATTANVPLDAVSNRAEKVGVRFRQGGQWSPWGEVSVTVEAGPPAPPMITARQVPGQPKVVGRVVNPTGGAYSDTTSNAVYAKGPDGLVRLVASGIDPDGDWADDWPGSGRNAYWAVATAPNGATAASEGAPE